MILEISQADLAKIEKRKAKEDKAKISQSWLFLAEFGYYFGWGGVQAIRNDKSFTMEEAEMLIKGARKVWSSKVYDYASASFIGAASANAKKPSQVFKKATADLVKNAKADK